MIHIGQMAGRKDHPESGREDVDPDDLAIVRTDKNENVVEYVKESTLMPSTEQRQEQETDGESLDETEVRKYIEELREQGKEEEADRAKQMLLGD